MKTYLYDINEDNDFPGTLFVSIVSEDFWNQHHCMDDETPEELYDALEPHGFSEAMESVFEFEGTRGEVKQILQGLGMRPDEGFNEYLANLEG